VTTFGIVVAAGVGERFGRPKALVELGGRPLYRWGADALEAAGCDAVVVVGEVPGGIPGGERRRDSVAAGLAVAPPDVARVVIHDAARPLASPGLVQRVIGALGSAGADGAIPALAVRDTLKRVEGDLVVATVDRSRLVAVQTPQAFRFDALVSAHRADDDDATDDAALVERAGGMVVVVPGEERNLKVTYPADLAVMEAML
jgi:2-C-methyl-D-erythritol 4-phosphate cytidylyltransferase